ncbi:MAG: LruC domain-containing protein, partial [Lentisphaerales bacterium]|nr:LruC domain-containing protein [Lentisphaerales bacterium]
MRLWSILVTSLLAVTTHAGWNSKGVPDNLVEDTEVSTALLRDIDRVLPERGTPVPVASPEFFSGEYSSNIYLSEEANVYVTFVHEGAGYRNSFGYFTYTADTVPATPEDVVLHSVFPNSSYKGSGGGLETGNTVRIGPFPAGTYVGFWVKANAWNRWTHTVGDGYWTHFTLPHLNTEQDETKKQHVAMFWHEETEKLIMGFEDIHRESGSCDQDFNDLIFFARTDPVEAMDLSNFVTIDADLDSDNDGIPDNSDVYPDDPERASTAYFPSQNQHNILAFEDNFPSKDDYDFNDLVITYKSQEIRNADNNLKELIMNMKVKAMGAMFHNGFAIQFPFTPDTIESASLLINGVPSEFFPIEHGHENETVINIMFAVPQHIDGQVFPNTLEGTQEKRGDRF